jgi:hypothetical protein
MEISKYSRNHILRLAKDWDVGREYLDPIYNYLVHGFEPGSFYSALLANDFFKAMLHSHPSNSALSLKNLTNWIRSTMGFGIFWGSEDVVKKWLSMTDIERRGQLERLNLIYSEKEEILMILKDQRTDEPVFF